MQKINIWLLATAICLFVSLQSCSEVLEVNLDDEVPSEEAITDQISLNSAVVGLYDILQSGTYYGGEFTLVHAVTGGIGDASGFRERFIELENAKIPTTNLYIESAWIDAYAVVNASNLILNKAEELQIDDANAIGSGHFLRALGLFDALRQFGQFTDMNSEFGIPVFTNYIGADEALTIPRASVSEAYQQIISDLLMAIDMLDYSDNRFFASKAAAEALLARVYLYQGEYAMAEQYADAVISNGDYDLNRDYNDIYDVEGSLEAILELQFLDTDGNSLTSFLSIGTPEISASYDDFYVNMADDDDPRGDKYYDDGRVVFVDKYGTNDGEVSANAILIKLSEIYLIKAEAQARQTPNNLTDAIETLNMVRTRSLPGMPITAADAPNYDAFVDVLLEERARELAFEGHRWFDVVRLEKAEEILGIESFRTVYPIPQSEVAISGGVIVQNPGY
ncbi:RagB/SusD family nutrient uptake outer membrane protein [Galbibacter mesophilus]|uniref:RagB/SusD family nutrient uptake outer membrane protein n=1 Tax=Galbibacter mesophilus TaxID=379069 RepID=UPI00191DFC72|nr:RagB/SusD family nutrient uptake outer membrane protein [Galbibacter mesophilus]MCM5661439.1 RagB/SusD family nutrient uptake outer membrane protein [Galbibacter mesophilus]